MKLIHLQRVDPKSGMSEAVIRTGSWGRSSGLKDEGLDAVMQADGGQIKPGWDLSPVEMKDLLPSTHHSGVLRPFARAHGRTTRASCDRPVIKDNQATFILTKEHKHDSTKPVPGFSAASFETSLACLKSVN